MTISLEELGWGNPFKADFAARHISGEIPARVVEEQRESYIVLSQEGEFTAGISGRMRHKALRREDFPAVGDWAAITARPKEKAATIEAILPRKSKLSRKTSGQETNEQLIATNLDTVFIVTSLNKDFNIHRLERYLALVSDSGALPVVLLSKADLCTDPDAIMRDIRTTTAGVSLHAVSAVTGRGLEALEPFLKKGETIALIGSSGVGKSTLINKLIGWERQKVRTVRQDDDRGRHTTTFRRLIPLPQGGLLIDTPGMRELQLWDTENGVEGAYPDIVALAAACRFSNCRHHTDAGCAVQAAIQDGRLPTERYLHYLRLSKESNDLAERRETIAGHKANQKFKKAKLAYKREPKN